jgi:triacylglycerol lipase
MKKRLVAAAASAAVALGGLAALAAPAAQAAAPTSCDLFDVGIYQPPASVPSTNGELIKCNATTASNVPGNIANKAWKVQYASKNAKNQAVAVSGTVIVPTAAWTGGGTRPVVAFNPGTLGIGLQCAFSKQLTGSYQDEYEGTNIERLLGAGIAVAATDGVGYLNGQVHPYVIGANSGHAMLDIAKAASQVPGSGLSASTKVGLWGYSEGGQASLWAAQLAASYAPTLNVVGAAAGGVPGDLKMVASQLNGGPFAGFLADAAIGLSTAYPELPFTALLNQTGKDAVKTASGLCLYGTLGSFVGAKIESFTTAGYSLDQLYKVAGADGTTWGSVLDAQKLGVGIGKPGSGAKYTIGFPTFQYRGALEEIINTQAEDNTRTAYCAAGVTTDWNAGYPGEHLTTDGLAVDDSVKWLTDRFKGTTTKGNC